MLYVLMGWGSRDFTILNRILESELKVTRLFDMTVFCGKPTGIESRNRVNCLGGCWPVALLAFRLYPATPMRMRVQRILDV